MPLGEDDQGDNLSLLRFAENMVEMSTDEFGQLLLLSLGPPPWTQPADTMVDVTQGGLGWSVGSMAERF
jgi:hypothetical protein